MNRRIWQSGWSFWKARIGLVNPTGTFGKRFEARIRSVRIAKSEPSDLAIRRELSGPPESARFGLPNPNRRIWQPCGSFWEPPEPLDLAIRREIFGNCPNALGSDCQIRTARFGNPAGSFWEPPNRRI
ncbi:hypothetical protein QUF72_01445 [Desulfobacterales bacterium HSG2]|nr:hypothetical protein [Desulfobacterales bacterium HSG2]